MTADAPQSVSAESSASRRRLFTEDSFEASFRRDYPIIWLLTLVGPFALTAALIALIYLGVGARYGLEDAATYVRNLIATALATFFGAGKFMILFGREGTVGDVQKFFTSGQLFLLVLYMDLMTAALLVFHTGFLFKLPVIGWKLNELIEDGQFILKQHPWMKRVTFIGIIAFVMFPLAATGSVGGSIFGRLLGMSRLATFIGITIGSLLGCGTMYYGAELINEYIDKDNPLLLVGGIALIAAIIMLLNYRYKQMKTLHLAEQSKLGERNSKDSPKARESSSGGE